MHVPCDDAGLSILGSLDGYSYIRRVGWNVGRCETLSFELVVLYEPASESFSCGIDRE